MINEKPLAILMCTYNGAHAIKEQIESILAQTFTKWNLYIHDDGSTDSTKEIVQYYIEHYPSIYLIPDDVKGRGAKNSFIWLMTQIKSRFYMFCDQDDFWLDNKIELTMNKLLELETENGMQVPIIVHSDLYVVDSELNLINDSFWNYSKLSPKLLSNLKNLQILNCVTGCAMGFNNSAKECSLPMNSLAPMHDWWIALSTLKSNGIIYGLDICTIKYRQHARNVVGARNIGLKYVLKKIRTLISVVIENEKHLSFLKSFSGMTRISFYTNKFILSIKRFYYVTK